MFENLISLFFNVETKFKVLSPRIILKSIQLPIAWKGGGMIFFLLFGCLQRRSGIASASLRSLAGRYDNPIPTRFLAPIDCSKIPAQFILGEIPVGHHLNLLDVLRPQPIFKHSKYSSRVFTVRLVEIGARQKHNTGCSPKQIII
jgi:hypothetical protein